MNHTTVASPTVRPQRVYSITGAAPRGPMRLLFVVPELFYSEPLGVMQLSSLAKQLGHDTKLCVLSRDSIRDVLDEYQPDLVGYSVMTPNEPAFIESDKEVIRWSRETRRKVFRLMGGPHPTFFPKVLDDMGLDAIVIGHGDNAMVSILERMLEGESIDGIPNVVTPTERNSPKEVVTDFDSLPFMDRDLIYDRDPTMRRVGIRSLQTSRGCPYRCTYCFNHSFNEQFDWKGTSLMTRRSVDHTIAELKHLKETDPQFRFVLFTDSVFTVRADAWLEEFAEKYPKEIGLPFVCCVQPKDLNDDVAALLQKAGCQGISSSIEAGRAQIRQKVLLRNISDNDLKMAFDTARRYGIKTQSNAMLGIPGTTLEDDFETIRITQWCRPDLATFGIFSPYPGTELSNIAEKLGLIGDNGQDYNNMYRDKSALNNYTEEEKLTQIRLANLGSAICALPTWTASALPLLARMKLTPIYRFMNSVVVPYRFGNIIFKGSRPPGFKESAKTVWFTLKYYLKWK